MTSSLFRIPVSNFIDQKISEARTQAERLSDSQLQDPSLAGVLEQIADFDFEVAKLNPEGRQGKRRTEKKARNDYGREIIVDVDFVDVTVPFTGDAQSLELMPSSGFQIHERAGVSRNGIVVSFLDDQNLDRNVDSFIKRVSENLKNLNADIEKIRSQRLQIAQSEANRRLEKIRARKDLDKSRSFPIT